MNTTDLPDWLTVGKNVVPWNGRMPSQTRTVERITATQIVCTDGSRWRRKDLTQIGVSSSAWHGPERLVAADDPQILAHHAERCRRSTAAALEDASRKWRGDSDPTDEQTTALADAVRRIAPHLGLTVTVDADRCQFTATDLDGPCLLPAGHVDTGEWHKGLGWVASIRSDEVKGDDR